MPSLTFYHPSQAEANRLRDQLNKLAAQHGYAASRGRMTERGGGAELLTAIANGEVALVLLADEQRAWAAEWLEEWAGELEHPSLAEALETIAAALRDAMQREAQADAETDTD